VLVPRFLGWNPDEAAIAAALPRASIPGGDRPADGREPVSHGRLRQPRRSDVLPLLYYFDDVPDGRAPIAEHPTLQNWVRHMETRQSFQVTKPPPF
jgi:hypothetical protein